MVKKIFKYPLQVTDLQFVAMPINSQILCAQVQNGIICLWALVNPFESTEEIAIEIVGTGYDVYPASRNYIGTVQLAGGNLVFHIFRRQ